MQAYYYLTHLKDSPYEISIADCLHLGATGALSVYALMKYPIKMVCRTTNEAVIDHEMYLEIPPQTVATIENRIAGKLSRDDQTPDLQVFHETFPLRTAYIDEKRFSGTIPIGTPFFDYPPKHLFIVDLEEQNDSFEGTPYRPAGRHPQICAADLVLWTEDLEKLADKGRIKRRTGDPSTANSGQPSNELEALPANFSALYDSMGAGDLPHLEILIAAWVKFWRDRSPEDGKGRYPDNGEVAEWARKLMDKPEKGKNKAKAIASIIRPTWAPIGRQPNHNE